jgi:hypothetical protein
MNIEGKDFGGIECTILKENVTIKVKYMDKDIPLSGKNCKPKPTKYHYVVTQCDLYMYIASPTVYVQVGVSVVVVKLPKCPL